MISTAIVFALFIGSSWTKSVDGLPYSKVFVQSGPDVVPVEYVNYGPPPVAGASLVPVASQAVAAPIGQLVPCAGPCLPGQQIVSVTPPSAKLVGFKAPNVPVVVKEDVPLGYQYSYVVYDENTGDQKAQSELSDGAVVQGQYSLIQPDGIVREVLYTADDLKGFNAIVKNFLPKTNEAETKELQEPCKQNEALTELSHETKSVEHGESHEERHNAAKTEAGGHDHKEGERHIDQEASGAQEKHAVKEDHAEDHVESAGNSESQVIQGSNALLQYNDIIKCLQAALQNKNKENKAPSPLTYVILNKPC